MTDFKSKQYKKVLEANERRNEISGKVNTKWTPLDECVHTQLYKAQAELIDLWVKEEEKRLPPSPPMSPFN
tara:strand:+ start:1712 stop:1924 length:213 start_codon:yes stop_codon:yes gene_type:complete